MLKLNIYTIFCFGRKNVIMQIGLFTQYKSRRIRLIVVLMVPVFLFLFCLHGKAHARCLSRIRNKIMDIPCFMPLFLFKTDKPVGSESRENRQPLFQGERKTPLLSNVFRKRACPFSDSKHPKIAKRIFILLQRYIS